MVKYLCEYRGCNKKATRVLKTKQAGVLARYCEEHYQKVIKDLYDIIKLHRVNK